MRRLKNSKAPALTQVTDGSSGLSEEIKCQKMSSCAGLMYTISRYDRAYSRLTSSRGARNIKVGLGTSQMHADSQLNSVYNIQGIASNLLLWKQNDSLVVFQRDL